jgi:hypothetical protein
MDQEPVNAGGADNDGSRGVQLLDSEPLPLPPEEPWPAAMSSMGAPGRPTITPPPDYVVIKEFTWKKVAHTFIDIDCDNIVDLYGVQPHGRPIVWYDINEFSGHPAYRWRMGGLFPAR